MSRSIDGQWLASCSAESGGHDGLLAAEPSFTGARLQGSSVDLLAFTTSLVLSVVLGLAGARLMLAALFFLMKRNGGLGGCAEVPGLIELTYGNHLRHATAAS